MDYLTYYQKYTDSIANCGRFEYLYDGDNKWKIFDSNNLFAVKRVERDINNPLRIYIRGLN